MQNIQWIARLLTHTATVALILAFLYWLISKMSPGAKAFWLGVFSDEGTPSFSRVATGVLLISCVVWDSYIVYFTRALPDFGGQTGLIGVLYGLNVGSKAVSKLRTGPDGTSSTTVTSTRIEQTDAKTQG